MPFELKLAGQTHEGELAFGVAWPRSGRDSPGFGWSVDASTALKLLEAIKDGHLEAEQAQQILTDLISQAGELVDESRRIDWAYARCFGDCDLCMRRKAKYEGYVAKYSAWAQAWEAAGASPDRYPFAMTKSTVHRSDCGIVTPAPYSLQHKPIDLRTFAHIEGDVMVGALPSTRHETHVWMSERTGPKGGRNYRLCKTCSPEIDDGR
ncbi:hypothetical protein [Nocardiopsis alba]|uniref:hypothetical protein n=1 Tax=Nocardiopsis alba TaxID=53437 RepID=UPI0011D1F9FB|nr:hypothetical protein [Nocardiopsis alba]